jgi:hypothetical protein
VKELHPHILNIHEVNGIRQMEIHTAESLVPDPCPYEVEICTVNLKSYTWPAIDQILAE